MLGTLSAWPRFYDGDLVLGEMIDELHHTGIVAVSLNGELLVKHLHRTPQGEIQLISENRIYPVIVVHNDDDFRIIGRIVRRITRV